MSHKSEGKPSNNAPIPKEIKQTIVSLVTRKYAGFGVIFLCEKLRENTDTIRLTQADINKIKT